MDDELTTSQIVRPTRAQYRRRLRENDSRFPFHRKQLELNLIIFTAKRDQDKQTDNIESSESKSITSSAIELGRRPRETKVVEPAEQIASDDVENQKLFSADEKFAPPKVLEPIRSDPVNALHARQRRLERLSIENMPEYHFIGQICSGRGITQDSSEGAYCRYILRGFYLKERPILF